MRTWVSVLILLLGLITSGTGTAVSQGQRVTPITDSAGSVVRLSAPAQRVISLSPHITELLYAVGAGAHVVGVADHSDYPPSASALPIVSSSGRIDRERILALHPDLVVVWGGGAPAAQIAHLRQLGLTVYVSEPHTIADIAVELRQLGQLVGTERIADAAATAFLGQLAALRARYTQQPTVTVFYQVWDPPLMTVGAEHLISQVIELCGGRSVFSMHGNLAPTVSREAVLAANPEVIIASGIDAHRPAWLDDWRAWPSVTAVRRDNLFDIPPDFIQRHTPRLLVGAQRLCDALAVARQRRPAAALPLRKGS